MNEQVSMTVLVIDDDAHIRSSIGKFLIARGHTVIEAADGEVGAEDLGFDLVENSSIREISSMPAARVVDQVVQSLSEKQMNLPAVEKALIQEALRRTGGNQAHAAEILGISRMVLRNRMKRCGLL